MSGVPGLKDQVAGTNADGDPLGRETGSVVGIHFEVAGMYTGTLINDLMAAVERAELKAERQRIAEERELHEMFAMQVPVAPGDDLYMGAA